MSRDEAAVCIWPLVSVQLTVGKDYDHLVVGANVAASKPKKAEKLGTKQISDANQLQLLRA